MKNKPFINAFITVYAIGVIPLIGIGFLVQDSFPTEWVQTTYVYVTENLMWNSGLTTPFYPITSSLVSLYNGIAAPTLALVTWIINRKVFSPLTKAELKKYSLADHFYAIIQLSLPYLLIGSFMLYFNPDLSHAAFGLKLFSWNSWAFIFFNISFIFPLWLFMNFLCVYVLLELSSKFIGRKAHL
ncbi:hypothetical protein ACGVWS_15595 [Enterobacteriaceae bacterium LUAb1]